MAAQQRRMQWAEQQQEEGCMAIMRRRMQWAEEEEVEQQQRLCPEGQLSMVFGRRRQRPHRLLLRWELQ